MKYLRQTVHPSPVGNVLCIFGYISVGLSRCAPFLGPLDAYLPPERCLLLITISATIHSENTK
jgi:hypothetical protein